MKREGGGGGGGGIFSKRGKGLPIIQHTHHEEDVEAMHRGIETFQGDRSAVTSRECAEKETIAEAGRETEAVVKH